jgi:hypothetical protein
VRVAHIAAATLLPVDQHRQTQALQALEVRAFGCLLEELLVLAEPAGANVNALAGLAVMAQACLEPDVAQRPVMAELVQVLAKIVR